MKSILLSLCFCLSYLLTQAQKSPIFQAVYPIGENPSIGYKSNMYPKQEKILFEANPILRMPIYNSIRRGLMNAEQGTVGSTLYINFKPQFRMYHDVSKPVRMPSYRISILGYQQLIRLPEFNNSKEQFLAFAVESGHYSNGQSRSAFSSEFEDGSVESKALYQTITDNSNLSEMLNRKDGNFSTNYTEVFLKYKLILDLNDDTYIPNSDAYLQLGYNRYHNRLLFLANLGGYTEEDIKIFGKNRFYFDMGYMKRIQENTFFNQKLKIDRFQVDLKTEIINKPHPSVNPFRMDLTGTLYFQNDVGIFLSGIYGHDNYNYRFVDKGKQIFVGITFDIFPPMEIK